MSGLAGIVNFDGKPVRRPLVQQMVDGLTFRGPDSQGVWGDGSVALIHTFLSVTDGLREQQPYTLDGDVWIVADARVDGRQALVRELTSRTEQERLNEATDVELLLRSYLEWGSDCVDHLLGDFAFAIWDGRSRQLFCARDHFGVKPFYYAYRQECLVFSNTLSCVRQHPAVSDELNEVAIADFLLFAYNKETGTTTFADVKRLRPGHRLLVSDGGLEERSYWQLPVEEPLRYRRGEAYVEHFREIFDQAVGDRLRTSQVGVLMSGGLDSTSVAATAHAIFERRERPFSLSCFTNFYEERILDKERHFSGLVGDHLGLTVHYVPADNYTLYQGWEEQGAGIAQPVDMPIPAVTVGLLSAANQKYRVLLTGLGGDPALYPSERFPLGLLWSNHLIPSLIQLGNFVRLRRRLPPFYLRTTVKRWLGKHPPEPTYPSWLNERFAKRINLRTRWKLMEKGARTTVHPWRPEAYRLLRRSFWPYVFENYYDAGTTSYSSEVLHPFFDVRLASFLLRVPPLPWFIRKEIVRRAMREKLPNTVRLRPKSPLTESPIWVLLDEKGKRWIISRLNDTPLLGEYVDLEKYMALYGERHVLGAFQTPLLTRPLSLSYWLRQFA